MPTTHFVFTVNFNTSKSVDFVYIYKNHSIRDTDHSSISLSKLKTSKTYQREQNLQLQSNLINMKQDFTVNRILFEGGVLIALNYKTQIQLVHFNEVRLHNETNTVIFTDLCTNKNTKSSNCMQSK